MSSVFKFTGQAGKPFNFASKRPVSAKARQMFDALEKDRRHSISGSGGSVLKREIDREHEKQIIPKKRPRLSLNSKARIGRLQEVGERRKKFKEKVKTDRAKKAAKKAASERKQKTKPTGKKGAQGFVVQPEWFQPHHKRQFDADSKFIQANPSHDGETPRVPRGMSLSPSQRKQAKILKLGLPGRAKQKNKSKKSRSKKNNRK